MISLVSRLCQPAGTPLLPIAEAKPGAVGKRTLGHRQPYRHSVGVHRQVRAACCSAPFCAGNGLISGAPALYIGMGLELIAERRINWAKSAVINHCLQQSGPHAPVPPAAEAAVGVLPVSIVRGQIAPRSAGAQYPAHGVNKPPVASPGSGRPRWPNFPQANAASKWSQSVRHRSYRDDGALPSYPRALHTLPISKSLPPYHHFDDTPLGAVPSINRTFLSPCSV